MPQAPPVFDADAGPERPRIAIRAATPADAAGIVAVLNPIVATGRYTVLDREFTVDEETAFIAGFPARGIFHLAVADGVVVGFQTVEPFASFTRAFDHVGAIGTFVDLGRRRQGIGSRLFAATFAAAAARGYEKLFTYVRHDNPAALAAYVRQGFGIVGTAARHARVGGRDVDEVIIEKWLGPGGAGAGAGGEGTGA